MKIPKSKLHEEHLYLLDHLKEAVVNKWDGVALIDGLEGSGKSGLAFLSACYLDPSFCLDRVVFTPDQFEEAVEEAGVGQCIVWDEFVTGGMSSDFMSEMQRALVKRMTMIRKKRLFILWVLPYFFLAGRYFAVARSRYLLHTYTPDGISRGTWRAWNYKRKKLMYFRGKREFDYCVSPYRWGSFIDFFGTFPSLLNEKDYEAKKEEASRSLEDTGTGTSPKMKKLMRGFSALIGKVRAHDWMTPKEIADTTGYTRTWIYQITEKGDADGTEKN